MESICQCCSSNLSLGMLLLPGLRQKRAGGDLPEPRYLIPEALHRLWGEEETRPYCLLFGLLVKRLKV